MNLDELITLFRDGGATRLAFEQRDQFVAETQQQRDADAERERQQRERQQRKRP
jgi:hypothetical protein